jgi:hypothetical protein
MPLFVVRRRRRNIGKRRCRSGGRSLLVKNCLVAICFKCLKLDDFLNLIVYPPADKIVRYKTSLICSRSTNEIFSEPLLRKNKNGERKQLQSTAYSSGIIVLRDYLAIYNQRHQKLSKRKNRDQFCPTFMPGKYSQASTFAPSTR